MGDIVESHAYNFKKEVGYDLFNQCEEIADRLRIARPVPPKVGDKMSELTAKYYSEILQIHERVREEEGEDHPTYIKELEEQKKREEEEREEEEARIIDAKIAYQADAEWRVLREKERYRLWRITLENGSKLDFEDFVNENGGREGPLGTITSADGCGSGSGSASGSVSGSGSESIGVMRSIIGDSDGSQMDEVNIDNTADMDVITTSSSTSLTLNLSSTIMTDGLNSNSNTIVECKVEEVKVVYKEDNEDTNTKAEKMKIKLEEEEIMIKEELSKIDIDTLPAMKSLLRAMEAASEVS